MNLNTKTKDKYGNTGRWVTINSNHIFIADSIEERIAKVMGVKLPEKDKVQIIDGFLSEEMELINYLNNPNKNKLLSDGALWYLKEMFDNEEIKRGNNEATDYSDWLVDYLIDNEGVSYTAYNNGQTIGYGLDFENFPEVKIKYNKDGKTISQKEAERLLIIVLEKTKEKINNFLKKNNLKIDQNTFDALMDLYYNRDDNELTQEILLAMARKDDRKVKLLLSDFDYRYAYRYVHNCIGDSKASQDYVDRNPGLKIRRENEYNIYKNGFSY